MSVQSFRIMTCAYTTFLCSIVVLDLHAASTGVGYSSKIEYLDFDQDGSHDVYYYKTPTYNGVAINTNNATLKQYASELGYDSVIAVWSCYESGETYPDCKSWGYDATYGYNDGKWESQICSYNDWWWDNCYVNVSAVLLFNASSFSGDNTECTGTYSKGTLTVPCVELTDKSGNTSIGSFSGSIQPTIFLKGFEAE